MNSFVKISLTCVSVFLFSKGFAQGIKYPKNDTIKFIVKNELPRFFSGTFWNGIEYPLNNKKSVYVSGIITYGSPLSSDKQLIGGGGEIQYRSYLGKGDFSTNYPIYLAAQLMYRRIDEYNRAYSYTPIYDQFGNFVSSTESYSESKRGFNVYYGGILLGGQVFVSNIFTIDLNFGGGLRLAQIDGEKSFSRYKNLTSLDYSGVVPRIGVVIGVIQH